DLHRDLELPNGKLDARDVGERSHPAMDEQMELTDACALELEREADGSRIRATAVAPVGDPAVDLEAPSVPECRELGDPQLRSQRADRVERGDRSGEHGADRMQGA